MLNQESFCYSQSMLNAVNSYKIPTRFTRICKNYKYVCIVAKLPEKPIRGRKVKEAATLQEEVPSIHS